MKQLYLIRHAKSSWADSELTDYQRPLNKRGKANGPVMAGRLAAKGILPDIIVSSPARRAKRTARFMAAGTAYDRGDIVYYEELYLGTLSHHLDIIATVFKRNDSVFLVGHNHTITDLANFITGESLENVPTCGIVGVGFSNKRGFSRQEAAGKMLFFDYPKKGKHV